MVFLFGMVFTQKGFERPLRKHAGGMFLGRGRIHGLMNAPGTGVGIRPSKKSVFLWYGIHAEGIRTIQCNSPGDCCLRRLDGAEPLFSRSENVNESLQVHQKENHPKGWFSLFGVSRRSLPLPLGEVARVSGTERGMPDICFENIP